jgi:type IV secretory pathway VirB10-like protein
VYRGLLQAGAWTVATAVAVTLSWVGVHSVLRSTAYDAPRALPIATTKPPEISDATSQPPPASSTPARSPSTAPPTRTATKVPVPPKTPPGTPQPTASPTAAATGNVHSYTLRGGRVVLDLSPTDASLVTATPTADWKMQVWTQSGWLRVTFTSADGSASSSLFCTWNGHPPSVQSYED